MPFAPRPYQTAIYNSVNDYTGSKKILINLLTGLGKTKESFMIMNGELKDKRFIFLVPRINLALQTFAEQTGLGFIQGQISRNLNARVIIATAQTIVNRIDKKRIDVNSFDYIIMDEVQSLTYKNTKDYKKMGAYQKIEHNFRGKIIGLSATPFNGDGSPLLGLGKEDCDIFGEEYDFTYAVDNGYLSPVLIREVATIDSSKLKESKTTGDFTDSSVKEMLEDNNELDIVGSCIPYIVGKTAVFSSNIEHCDALNADFLSRGIKSEVMHSSMDGKPQEALDRFNRGEIDVLVTVNSLSFGQDVHNLQTLILATAIGSLSRYKQIIGRGLRPAEGKTFCHILDCMGNIERLGHPFNKVIPPNSRPKTNTKKECEECGSEKPYVTTHMEIIKEEEVKRVVKQCPECENEIIDLLPMPTVECDKCGVIGLLGSVYYTNNKVMCTCEYCNEPIKIQDITPSEMVISFQNRDNAVKDIVRGINARFKDDEALLNDLLSSFAIFSTHCKTSDLGYIMDYILNLRNNYTDSSMPKLIDKMNASNKNHNRSNRERFIRVFRTLQDEVNFEFIDFLFNNTPQDKEHELMTFFEKMRQSSKRKKANKDNSELDTKQLKSLAKRNYSWLKK